MGKTELSIRLAKEVGGEIINADSTLVYRFLDVGTAKPTVAERQGVPHHLIDILDPNQPFSVAEFCVLARQVIVQVQSRRHLPILVGGTGLYLKALVEGYEFAETQADMGFRDYLRRLAQAQGPVALHSRLTQVDPGRAARIHPHDVKRVIRALEIHQQLHSPMSQVEAARAPGYEVLFLVLTRPRETLYRRIDQRVLGQIRAGLVEEVALLLSRGYDPQLFPLRSLGYKEIIAYLKGLCSLEEAIRLIQRNTRRLAKRQLTWFKGQKGIIWIEVGENTEETLAAITRQVEEKWGPLERGLAHPSSDQLLRKKTSEEEGCLVK